ncbi:NACHT, LRR and PYD domains-containing protein 3-like isoform X2 [Rhopilema esculentum]|uniref:NACHT, LRR and PYD domains-containing protein 3-like isoform X2 n=1 Tax=Rhopilema esculentum TaxID=499914 RepID=UPI0031E20CFC
MAQNNITINQGNVIIGSGQILQAGLSDGLKQLYIKHFSKWTVPVINNKGYSCVERDCESFMVNLHIVEGEANEECCHSFNEIHRYMDRPYSRANFVPEEELTKQKNGRVLVQGVAGVGKTSFLEHIALSWAKQKLFQKFDLLFLLKCRSLIRYQNITISSECLFDELFGVSISYIKRKVDGEKVLIILDGLDELPSLEEIFKEEPSCSLHSIIRDLIKKESTLLPGHTCIFTGRPHVQSVLLKNELGTLGKLGIFEITGFSEETIAAYVGNFAAGDEEVKNRIMTTVQESVSLRAMAAVPQFLSSLCGILASKETDKSIHRTTELYVWVLISFIRQHFVEMQEMPYRILLDTRFRNFIGAVSRISYELLASNKRVFTQEEFTTIVSLGDPLEKKLLDSFLIKIETATECLYQFKHVSLQEFLAGVHCFEAGVNIKELLSKKMYIVAGFVAGLSNANERARNHKNDIVSMFVHSILNEQHSDDFLLIKDRPTVQKIAVEIFEKVQERKITWKPFLAIFYELFREDDSIPKTVDLFKVMDFSFDNLSTIECVHFVHCMKTILKSFGTSALSEVTLKLMNSHLSLKKTSDLSQVVEQLCGVKFIACTVDTEFVNSVSQSIQSTKNSTNLSVLVFSNCDLSEEHISILSSSILFLKRFEIWYNNLTACSMSSIAIGLMNNRVNENFRLKELRLHGCKFAGNVTPSLCKIIQTVENLDLTRCKLEDVVFEDIVDCILSSRSSPRPCRLKGLVLEKCDINDSFMQRLCDVIPYLERINISRSASNSDYYEFQEETVEKLANCIQTAYDNQELLLKRLTMNFFSHNENTRQRFNSLRGLDIEVFFALW